MGASVEGVGAVKGVGRFWTEGEGDLGRKGRGWEKVGGKGDEKKERLYGVSLWCLEQERFNCFLLNTTICSCSSCNYLYTQITQRNPAKRRKGGQKVARNFCVILHSHCDYHCFSMSCCISCKYVLQARCGHNLRLVLYHLQPLPHKQKTFKNEVSQFY